MSDLEQVSDLGLRRESAPVKKSLDGLYRQFWPSPSKPYPAGVEDGFRYVTEWVAE